MEDIRNGEGLSKEELKRLARELGFPYIEALGDITPPQPKHIADQEKLLSSWAKQHSTLPIAIDENGHLVVATSDPLNLKQFAILKYLYERPLNIICFPEEEITRVINNIKSTLMKTRSSALEASSQDDENENELLAPLKIDVTDAEDADAPIIRYVNTMIFKAATQRASDIHIEPYENTLKVRFRIDGVLQDVDSEDKVFQSAILSRIKVMANLNIAEKRLPQDGRIGLKIAGRDVDVRVSTVPTRYGERIVMRLLDKSSSKIELESLGMAPSIIANIKNIIQKSYGIFLVTGPTGSGKTTTLYSALSNINSKDKNILTVEDPIEYELEGVGQMQVNPKINFTFANGLRAILRQDPDVIMVGEIRDLETVEIAIQASLTGHLVFSTLHTNDAPGAITRMLDIGVEPFLISSSLIAVLAQRLLRTLCPHCKVATQLHPEQLRQLGFASLPANSRVFDQNPNGCEECQYSGYKGRTGIHELLMIDEDIQSAIMQRANATQIRKAATGMLSLREDGAMKVLQGITSFAELMRVTQEDTNTMIA